MNPDASNKAIRITTPEGVSFAIPLATPIRRLFAVLIDLLTISFITNLVMTAFVAIGVVFADFGIALYFLATFIINLGYFIYLEWKMKGKTLGKKVMGIRVMDADGLRLQFSQIVIRNLMRAIDQLPLLYLVGGTTSVLNRKRKRLGDLVANTIVVRQEKVREPEWDQLQTGKYNSFRKLPHLAARLRQMSSPDETELALQAILRREDFTPEDRIELFAFLATHFRGYRVYPEETEIGLTDEQYIRNLVEVLFQRDSKKDAGVA